jgi:hypothetical protein
MFLPIWIAGAEVRSSLDDWRGTVIQQFGKTVVCLLHDTEPDDYLSTHRAFHAADLLPVFDAVGATLDRPAGVAAGVVQAAAAHAHRMAAKAGRLARHGRPVAAAFATRRGSATAVARTAEAVMGVNSLAARLFLSGSAASRRGRWCRWQRLAAARGYRDRLAERAPRQSGPSWACVRGVSPRATLGEAEP